jgi:hypothetical protein
LAAIWNNVAVPVFARGREEIWPWLERSAAVFYFLRLLVVALLRRKNFLARC